RRRPAPYFFEPELASSAPPPAPWAEESVGEISSPAPAGGALEALATGGSWWLRSPGGEFVHWQPDLERVRFWARPSDSEAEASTAYQQRFLPCLLHLAGHEILRASAILTPSGVVAFVGPPGAGKSTLAAGLGARGHTLWADDAVLFAPGSLGLESVRLPFRPQLAEGSAALLAAAGHRPERLRPEIARAESEALVGLLLLEPPAKNSRGPVQAGSRPPFEALAPSASFPRLLANGFALRFEEIERRVAMTRRYLALAAEVPCFLLGSEPRKLPYRQLLDRIETWLGRFS
ncbi:MAG TPA: hypothetical protein PK413_12025, partial [Thermoanaerobaculia bacterium]|nr:hypothetical protein [Thermoanaerobaculia bacterium]